MKIQKVSGYHAMSVAGADIIFNAADPKYNINREGRKKHDEITRRF